MRSFYRSLPAPTVERFVPEMPVDEAVLAVAPIELIDVAIIDSVIDPQTPTVDPCDTTTPAATETAEIVGSSMQKSGDVIEGERRPETGDVDPAPPTDSRETQRQRARIRWGKRLWRVCLAAWRTGDCLTSPMMSFCRRCGRQWGLLTPRIQNSAESEPTGPVADASEPSPPM